CGRARQCAPRHRRWPRRSVLARGGTRRAGTPPCSGRTRRRSCAKPAPERRSRRAPHRRSLAPRTRPAPPPGCARAAPIVGRRATCRRTAGGQARAEETEREREAAAVHRFDEERLRLAHELHDTIAHTLVGINTQAAAAVHLRRKQADQSFGALEAIVQSSADALAELRSTLKI